MKLRLLGKKHAYNSNNACLALDVPCPPISMRKPNSVACRRESNLWQNTLLALTSEVSMWTRVDSLVHLVIGPNDDVPNPALAVVSFRVIIVSLNLEVGRICTAFEMAAM